MSEYKIWTPQHDGHAPPNWREGMKWADGDFNDFSHRTRDPFWYEGYLYRVPAEALNSPNDDAAFDVGMWAKQTRDNLAAIEAAGHGITLADPKDWATELWAETFDIFDRPDEAELIRRGILDERDKEVISLFRTRFEQMTGEE